jgi:hypothetical protein
MQNPKSRLRLSVYSCLYHEKVTQQQSHLFYSGEHNLHFRAGDAVYSFYNRESLDT